MKKHWKAISMFLLSALALTGCNDGGNNSTKQDKIQVTFDYNYENAPSATVVEIDYNDVVEEPNDPQRTNYEFDGWYTEKSCENEVDFETALKEDVTYYAGWTQTYVTVNFIANYDGGKNTSSIVKVGESVSEPMTPTRSGYLFNGWYKEKETTSVFDFSTKLSQDLNLYAGWKADTGDNVTLTYMWNYQGAPNDGIFNTVTIEKNSKTTGLNPTREGYLFVGWYKDANCTDSFDFTKRITEDATLYAYWYKEEVFEAEYVDVSKIDGKGYSGEASGTKIIEKDLYNANASNGYYVSWLYNPGIKLEFNITASEACSNVYLSLRLSAEYYANGLTLTDDEFKVDVNTTQVTYSDLSFDLSNVDSKSKLPFQDFLVSKVSSLNKGDNKITLTINNDTKYQGTMYAKAPMVDCIKVYTDKTVAWASGYPLTSNLAGK